MEVEVVEALGPVGVDIRHVQPRGKGTREGVQEAVLRVVDLRHSQDVIDVRHDSDTRWRDEVCRRVASIGPIHVDAERLDLVCLVSPHHVAAIGAGGVCQYDK